MNLALDRGLSLLEHLSRHPDGLPLALMAEELDIPLSACHRLLGDLQQRGYVRQKRKQGDYQLTTKVVAIGLGYLSHGGIVDIAGPLLERLAQLSGELVRLSLVDDDRLTFVAKAQGARQQGVRYDPDMGADVWLSCSASGHAWLHTLSDERALELVTRQGFGTPRDYGPKAPTTVKAMLGFLHAARVRGYAMIDEVFAPGMSAMAAPVMRRHEAIGVISIAGPRTRLSVARMQELAPALLAAAAELGPISNASSLFGRPPLGKG
ncbi:MAG: helix-turn-helix domain-containing protein [Hydrogenophaga sp.]|uniref:IclR family transcriptional regulator n=1 Tax=Hydrogenophaga sp. TaxID=1904254 RepID=UPI0016B793C2|nr:IclR family transcriptional regulator [Hydrogenophaga sp.]NIM41921.1 helix-turn-helix domain-containing protein [Hydrogenophaga sp.]NIN27224.1 helix-turn-helix domain-containing protein [Hydrogenophaga sp.]NIN31925.1 helix-turn-helix domain-containing protein [Hydrogenophaga sp.]NIN56318.1 helix-turn-helix domain-containing protein [Hydrogenophaga sp.]NIO52298.1 helix-turn-helix domain-containing protein [Hydrogenophaga sp.]